MRRFAAVVTVLVVAALAAVAAPPTAPAGAVRAAIELKQHFFYVGDPMMVRLSITNGSDSEVANPVKSPLFGSFTVLDAQGNKIASQSKPEATEPNRPSKLVAGEFYGAPVDLSQMYPQLRSRGKYRIRWSADGISAEEILVNVIPKFDPAKEYLARVETEQGAILIELLTKSAPIAVKTFVDLANAGFYDGLLFHEARPNQAIGGGDPTGTGQGQAPISYPAELSAIPIVAGSVVLKPAGLAPPANSSQFVISLRPEPGWIAQFTVIGQVVEGLDVVRKISTVETSDRPRFRPLKDVHTIRITIEEKAPVTNRG